jgi:Icc-related predicted phosphoesterase
MARARSNHIKSFEANINGRDIIIADLHGSNGCLKSVIEYFKMKPEDRLFIAGDLEDRGPDSLGTIETVIDSDVNIQVARGDHEEMVLDSIQTLNWIACKLFKEKNP